VGDLRSWHSQQTKETVQDGCRIGWRLRRIRVESPQVHEQHLVERLLRRQEMPRVYCELGLADACHALDR
jgi:hypothetical protein